MMARPSRTAAVVGAVVAISATTLMGLLAGNASASTPGTCTENVNVRAEPAAGSRIVALCEAGTAVTTGAVRNGFVRIESLGGWAAEQYIAVDGASPNSTPRTAPSPSSDDDTTTAPSTTAPRSSDATGSGSGSGTGGSGSGSGTGGSGSGTGGSGSGGESGSTSRTGDDADTTGGSTSQDGTGSGNSSGDEADGGSGLGGGLLG